MPGIYRRVERSLSALQKDHANSTACSFELSLQLSCPTELLPFPVRIAIVLFSPIPRRSCSPARLQPRRRMVENRRLERHHGLAAVDELVPEIPTPRMPTSSLGVRVLVWCFLLIGMEALSAIPSARQGLASGHGSFRLVLDSHRTQVLS